jgi:hypothetical protein
MTLFDRQGSNLTKVTLRGRRLISRQLLFAKRLLIAEACLLQLAKVTARVIMATL